MMCGIQSSKRGLQTVLIDHGARLGQKILISGGGRCNFTNLYAEPSSYVCQNPHFVKSALSRYGPGDFISLVEKHKIPYHEKKLGQLFCDNSAKDIVDMLERECSFSGAQIELGVQIESISKVADGKLVNFIGLANTAKADVEKLLSSQNKRLTGYLITSSKDTYFSKALVVATGGLSVPKVGATGVGYKIATSFGHRIVETTPALDGFVFTKADKLKYDHLYGTACDVILKTSLASFRENILFTHLGLSGPASLQASLYWSQGMPIHVDFLPDMDVFEELAELRKSGTKKQIKSILGEWLPKRLAEKLIDLLQEDTKIAELSNQKLNRLTDFLKNHEIKPVSTVGFIKAEVTKGGVDTSELSSKTMQSSLCENLFFIGEVVDVTGQLGGFNFQWAWASGYAAGQAVLAPKKTKK